MRLFPALVAVPNGGLLLKLRSKDRLDRHYVIEGRYDGLHDFEFGLDLILDGLERLLERQQGEK